jgi:3'-phosphoadenosine 5'-phosphosulfate sulfotransferase (PAPS reductase)/FAD synthetase
MNQHISRLKVLTPISGKEVWSVNIISSLVEEADPYVLLSGGRDSLVTLHIVSKVAEAFGKKVIAIHVDTTASTPGNREYVEEVCRNLGAELVILKPKRDYFTLVERWGFPTPTRRWCCYYLKVEPIKDFITKVQAAKVIFDGIRAEESRRRRNYPVIGFHKHFKCLCCHAIFTWSSEEIKSYMAKNGLSENPLYKLFPRASECWCTAFKTLDQFRVLKLYYPDFFNRLVELESKLKGGGSALYKNGRKVFLKDLSPQDAKNK